MVRSWCGGERKPNAGSTQPRELAEEAARTAITDCLAVVTSRIRQQPRRVYVMGQRTKWGNCSSRKNLSFNWRLILAPDFVLRYLVTHKAVHPGHSGPFGQVLTYSAKYLS